MRPSNWKRERRPRTELLDALTKCHAALRQDILFHLASMKNQVKNAQIALTITVPIALGLLLSGPTNYAITEATRFPWIAIMLAITTISYFLFYNVLDDGFSVHVLSEHLVRIEKKLNDEVKSSVFATEALSETLYAQPVPLPGIIQPVWAGGIYQALMVFGVTVVLPGYVYYKVVLVTLPSEWGVIFWIVFGCVYSLVSATLAFYAGTGVTDRLRGEFRPLLDKFDKDGYEAISEHGRQRLASGWFRWIFPKRRWR